MQDVAGQEPADGEPFEMVFADGVPMLDGTVPPFALELAFRVVAELIQQIEQRYGKRENEEYGGKDGM